MEQTKPKFDGRKLRENWETIWESFLDPRITVTQIAFESGLGEDRVKALLDQASLVKCRLPAYGRAYDGEIPRLFDALRAIDARLRAATP